MASQIGFKTINHLPISVTTIISIIVEGNLNYPCGKIGVATVIHRINKQFFLILSSLHSPDIQFTPIKSLSSCILRLMEDENQSPSLADCRNGSHVQYKQFTDVFLRLLNFYLTYWFKFLPQKVTLEHFCLSDTCIHCIIMYQKRTFDHDVTSQSSAAVRQ